ncbi:MAG: ABC transporter permease [Pseudomonadota bacterium]
MKSLLNWKLAVGLSVLSIAVSVALFLGVEKVRTGAKESFLNTISGTDLIVGARSSGVQLLLYSVFHIGNATNNVRMNTIEDVAVLPGVGWVVPISLGDSYRGHRVIGTTTEFFDRYRYRNQEKLTFQEGKRFNSLFDVVLGSDVAQTYSHTLGDEVVLSHGTGTVSFADHTERPFKISGILDRTGTPIDRSVLVSLEAIEAIHHNWTPGVGHEDEKLPTLEELKPKTVTAAFVGIDTKMATFSLQRFINDYEKEPITAVLPGVAFSELWSIVSNVETALLVISGMVVVATVLGMMVAILSTLNERRREMAILRSVGAAPHHVASLLVIESLLITLAGIALGFAVLFLALMFGRSEIEQMTGIAMQIAVFGKNELRAVGALLCGSLVAGLVPAIKVYRLSLADGLIMRL